MKQLLKTMPELKEIDSLHEIFSSTEDQKKRVIKATRILDILHREYASLSALSCLEIGTGSGVMSRVFASKFCEFISVDIHDLRLNRGDVFDFQLISEGRLPFASESFDVIISAHVFQYVDSKELHLKEIDRVLKVNGIVYFATANRFALIEPHFNLPLLGYLPQFLASKYLSVLQRADAYRIYSQGYRALLHTLQAFFGSSGNCVRDGLGSAKKFRWNYVNKSPFSCLWDPFRVSISEHAL